MDSLQSDRLRGYVEVEFFARRILPHYFTRNFSKFHKELLGQHRIPYRFRKRGWRRAVAAPRGAGKSTIKTLLEPMHDLCYGFEPFIVIMANTSAQVASLAAAIRDEFENNQELSRLFPELYPIRSTQFDILTANGRRISARSAGQQIRGIRHRQFRPTKIILDDIEHSEAASKFSRREEFEDYIHRDVMQAGSVRTVIEHVGTLLHPESLLAHHMNSAGWSSLRFRSIEGWPERTDLWNECRNIWSDLSNPNREGDARRFFERNRFEMTRGCTVLDEENEDLLDLMIVLWRDGEPAFFAEKQNEPQGTNTGLLPMNEAVLFDPKELDTSKLALAIWLDTSLGKNENSDTAAIVVVGRDDMGNFFVLDAWVGRKPPSEQMVRLLAFMRRFGVRTAGFEDNGFQRLLLPIFDQMKLRENMPWAHLMGHTTTSNKHARIATLEPLIANGWLSFSNRLQFTSYWEQMSHYPSEHDDAPDATERAISMLSRRLSTWSYT